jgi:hypothetical protein
MSPPSDPQSDLNRVETGLFEAVLMPSGKVVNTCLGLHSDLIVLITLLAGGAVGLVLGVLTLALITKSSHLCDPLQTGGSSSCAT